MSGGMWTPFMELVGVINAAILKKEPNAYYSLKEQLKKHKPDFMSLLKNPPKNPGHRTQVEKAKDGIELPNFPNLHPLASDYIEEALILSDVLNINELSALELILAGEQQQSRFPSYTRGLVAVLLYHDGRRSIVSALRTLIQAREGVAWTAGLSPAIVNLVMSYTDELFNNGLVVRILSLLNSITVERELSILERGRGIGGPQHKQQVIDLVTEQRNALADCLLYWACQNPFPRAETLKILTYLRKVQVDTPSRAAHATTLPSQQVSREYGSLTPTSLSLLLTLLVCFDVGENTTDGPSTDPALQQRYPILTDKDFVPTIHAELVNEGSWETPELFRTVQFAWGVLLREFARPGYTDLNELLEDDEVLVEEGITGGAFHFLRQSVIASSHFHQEEFYVRRIHSLITSFIINMNLKVKDLRNLGDEVAKAVGDDGDMSTVRDERRVFEELMKLIGDLYSSDPNDLQLSSEFWRVSDDDTTLHSSIHSRASHRHLSLSKFLSTCSNFLPAPLFSAFMHMLIGLSNSPVTAHHCFELLKANSPTLGGGGASAVISLEHFFTSLTQYYLRLRNGGGARAPPTGCVIVPREVQGLKDVVTLIGVIAKQDPNARVLMYENQSWLPVASLFGLIGCPIPRDLKATILHTLATFALSPEIAGFMWDTLEVAQILNTALMSRGSGRGGVVTGLGQQVAQEGNLLVELEDIESKEEEYPLTRAFLELLLVLIKVPIPPMLGVGHRVPGFYPYLMFVRDIVFLKFDSRAYQDRNEKWEVARLSLEILCQLVQSHHLSPEDFTPQQFQLADGTQVDLPRPPGHEILEHMLNDSLLLKKVLSVLDEALSVLSSHSPTPPPEGVAHAALLCLQLLGATLEREEEFLDYVRRSKQQVSIHPLHHLLLGVNPRSGKADHMINIARYVGLTRCSPELALSAVQVLHGVAQTPKAGQIMAASLMGNKAAYRAILHGFVEHFDVDIQVSDSAAASEEESLDTTTGVQRAIQLQILKLLSACIDMPSPNIAHLLLGFEAESGKHISETTLQDPGVSGSPRTCLHSILTLVDHGAGHPAGPKGCHFSHPRLAELCYKVLYQLGSHRDLSLPTLRYLRNNHDFIHTQLSHVPLDPAGLGVESETSAPPPVHVSLLHQQAWLLRLAAIELRMTLLNHLRSHTQRLLNLLLSETSIGTTTSAGADSAVGVAEQEGAGSGFVQGGRRKILVLLDMVNFQEFAMPTMSLEYFDLTAVEGVMKMCEIKDPVSGALSCDVMQLRKLLMMELNSTQGPSLAANHQGILEEVHKLLGVVLHRNQVEAAAHLARQLFEAWRHLVEVTLHAMLQDDIKREMKVAVLFEVVQDLQIKMHQHDSSPLTSPVQGVILILLSHLRQTVLSSPTPSEPEDSLLPSLYYGPLLAIMSCLVKDMLQTPAGMQQVQAYLGGSLLYYLSMTRSKEDAEPRRNKGLFKTREQDNEMSSMAAANMSTINSFGEPFMEAICRNACEGHDVARMLSLSVLDAVLSLDVQGEWLKFLTRQGYLQNLCANLQWEDDSLKKMLHPVPEALRALYIYESKMAFLTQVAHTPLGARELTNINALSYLSQCQFIDLRPSHHDDEHLQMRHSHGFIPSVSDRYRQLLFPVLRLLLALLTCPGSHHSKLSDQVTSLIGAHSDVFAAILKDQHGPVTMATLQELALVTAVISNSRVGGDWSAQASTPFGSGLIRVQRLMLTLLPQFWSKRRWQKLVEQAVQAEDEEGEDNSTSLSTEAFLLVQQISANVVSYCRVAMTMGGEQFSSPYCRILLKPDLSEALALPASQDPFSSPSSSSLMAGTHAPSLGLLVLHLKECTDGFASSYEGYQHYLNKMENKSPLSSEDIRRLLPRAVLADKVALSQQQVLARKYLKTKVLNVKRELKQYNYVVESLLYLLWRHLQYYLLHCKPVDPELNMLGPATVSHAPIRRLDEISGATSEEVNFDPLMLSEGVTSQDLEQLKTNSVKCLTDTFFKKLLDLEEAQLENRAEHKVEFVQALMRRIKRLLKLKATPASFVK